jgi:hypothetical protein
MATAYGGLPAVMGFILGNEVNNADTDRQCRLLGRGSMRSQSPPRERGSGQADHDGAGGRFDELGQGRRCAGAESRPLGNKFVSRLESSRRAQTISTLSGRPSPPRAPNRCSSPNGGRRPAATTRKAISPSPPSIAADLDTYVSGHYSDTAFNSVTTSGRGGSANPNAVSWAPVCAGSAYFEWTDEWWKLDAAYPNVKCPATVQNPGLSKNAAFPRGAGATRNVSD